MKCLKCGREMYDKTAYYSSGIDGGVPIYGCLCGTIHFRDCTPVREMPPDTWSTPESRARQKLAAQRVGKTKGWKGRAAE